MSTQRHKVQMTVRLEPAVHEAAVAMSNRTGRPLAVVVADAAKQMLLTKYREQLDSGMDQFTKRMATQINRSRDQTLDELHVLKEMLGIFIRTYLNHTAPVPDSERESASRSGRARFARILKLLDGNLRAGSSVFDDLPVIEDGVIASMPAEAPVDDQGSNQNIDQPNTDNSSGNFDGNADHIGASPDKPEDDDRLH